ncbi:hypothetical protein [Actinoplanes solisilvae]|uniref:hypothetical protein n=1 Tax=Actinoplanes solisilvae TaxID=2486853 RepID=UPI000FD77A00|nr:hypothetical protein [Actinoplanes solisilvae]
MTPGLTTTRLLRLMRRSIDETRLDLTGAVVLTEAATGPYAVTPVLAAMAGATEVVALTRSTRYGTAAEVTRQTMALAEPAGVAGRITVTAERRPADIARADVVTNSGHVRPIDQAMVDLMKPTAVVPLMFEAWEAEAGRTDLDLAALRKRGIAVAGTNERHPAVDVFSYLGLMAVKLLLDAGIPPYRSRIAVLCDNPFLDFLVRGLIAAGAEVTAAASLGELVNAPRPEALIVSMRPTGGPVLSRAEMDVVATRWPGLVVAQYWGDLDRDGLTDRGLAVWPAVPPGAGHMGVLPSAVGPDPIVRLQTGGLKVAEVLLRPAGERTAEDLEFVDELG